MRDIFLSHSFAPEDRDLVAAVEAVIDSYGFRVITGRHLGGGQFTPEIQGRIEKCDGLIALLTRRVPVVNNRWHAPQWVLDELACAYALRKPALPIVDDGVNVAGIVSQHERADFIATAAMPTFVKLSQTLGMWRDTFGRSLKVLLMPEAVAARMKSGRFVCEYRFCTNGVAGPWKVANCFREPGGTYAYLSGADDDALVELRVKDGTKSWSSNVSPQWLHIEVS